MLKTQLLQQEHKFTCHKQHVDMYTRLQKNGMAIKFVVKDPTITPQQQAQMDIIQLESGLEIYQIFIELNRQNKVKIFRKINGLTQLKNHLKDAKNWALDIQNKKFMILQTYKQFDQNHELHSFQFANYKIADVYNIGGILQLLAANDRLSESQRCYLQEKAIVFQVQQKLGKERQSSAKIRQKRKVILEKKRQQNQKMLREQQIMIQRDQQKQKVAKEIQIQEKLQDAVRAKKQQIFNKIIYQCPNIKYFRFAQCDIIKQKGADVQRGLFGISSIVDRNYFIINTKKLTKQYRDPVLWIGVADKKDVTHQNINEMNAFIVMSDKKKIRLKSGNEKKLVWTNKEGKQLTQQIQQQKLLTVRVDKSQGIITWQANGSQIGSYQWELLKSDTVNWIPFIQLQKIGDTVSWIE